ncbi:uncharacterized protein PGTG_22781 [Puccinia graminis f. sp. tritici CRL 75-36-700-3]|uniref:Uncharacterized protein n=1 Tax=Puccinia graminis f. sp. tritici (strain CRL 75-36-700-3 / race SCCL) TaxID=418459 RepID=H6QVL2_PUCGT|nr:uncharacterized protein PGTG_22781 [Puccinia graminis f. sp. tritici CRL 75-36-700-3]EHS63267.1 hypothetical protein PGTG_22781 [Puccinia graminis f. sp. tritici CRL 75-36-700-3]
MTPTAAAAEGTIQTQQKQIAEDFEESEGPMVAGMIRYQPRSLQPDQCLPSPESQVALMPLQISIQVTFHMAVVRLKSG